MKEKQINVKQIVVCLVMIATLLWLTVSTPFVYSAKQRMEKQMHHDANAETEDSPLTNVNEEKSENTIILSEFLHEGMDIEQPSMFLAKHFKCYPSDVYFAFHPELVSPPPEPNLIQNVFQLIL